MSMFGDFEPDDAFGREPADPEQVAIKLHRLRRDRGLESVDWDALPDGHRADVIAVLVLLFAWLRRQGAAT